MFLQKFAEQTEVVRKNKKSSLLKNNFELPFRCAIPSEKCTTLIYYYYARQ